MRGPEGSPCARLKSTHHRSTTTPVELDLHFELPDSGVGLVLIVDDEKSSALLNQSILEAAGYQVQTFARASEVLVHLVSDEPIVLVTDFEMPEMSGIELAEHALGVDPDIKMILLTGRGGETDRAVCTADGLHGLHHQTARTHRVGSCGPAGLPPAGRGPAPSGYGRLDEGGAEAKRGCDPAGHAVDVGGVCERTRFAKSSLLWAQPKRSTPGGGHRRRSGAHGTTRSSLFVLPVSFMTWE